MLSLPYNIGLLCKALRSWEVGMGGAGHSACWMLCELFIDNRSLSSFEPPGRQRILAPYSRKTQRVQETC